MVEVSNGIIEEQNVTADTLPPFDPNIVLELHKEVSSARRQLQMDVECADVEVAEAVLEPLHMGHLGTAQRPSITNERLRSARGDRSTSYKRYFAFTKTGFVNTALWNNMASQFAVEWRAVHGDGLDCLLFIDNLGAHNSLDLHCALMKKGIYPTHLPRNSSSFTQSSMTWCLR